MKIANIIISEQSLPSFKNGSWTQRLEYFLKSSKNNIDYVVCSVSNNEALKSFSTFYYSKNRNSRIINKFLPKRRYSDFILNIEKVLKEYNHIIVCVVDNIKLLNNISDFVDDKFLKNRVTLIFYNCGYSYFLGQKEHEKFCKNIDEIIFLTKSAYLFNKKIYKEFTPEVSIINNPINKDVFYPVKKDIYEDEVLTKYNLKGKTVFLWLSHDRKKKGMSLVLNAWKSWSNKCDNNVLLIVGAKRELVIDNVIFVGKVDSKTVDKYYKCAHIYLFPTLCKEGFGLSLAQAICSGCFSIAANSGGVEDFFSNNDGILIDEPNIVENWVDAMKVAVDKVENGWENKNYGNQILTFNEWSEKFLQVFNKWQMRLKE
jgi:glycosyltransferase involved in cell wall biosynthesis